MVENDHTRVLPTLFVVAAMSSIGTATESVEATGRTLDVTYAVPRGEMLPAVTVAVLFGAFVYYAPVAVTLVNRATDDD